MLCALAMRDGVVPPTINLDNPDEGTAGFDLVPHIAREQAAARGAVELVRLRRHQRVADRASVMSETWHSAADRDRVRPRRLRAQGAAQGSAREARRALRGPRHARRELVRLPRLRARRRARHRGGALRPRRAGLRHRHRHEHRGQPPPGRARGAVHRELRGAHGARAQRRQRAVPGLADRRARAWRRTSCARSSTRAFEGGRHARRVAKIERSP